MASTACASDCTLALAWRRNSSASGVGRAPPRPRSNRRTPRISSSSLSVFVTAGCEIASASAARRRLRCSATARKHCRWRRRMRFSAASRVAGVLLVRGFGVLPGVALGALAADLAVAGGLDAYFGGTPWLSLSLVAVKTVHAALATVLLKRFSDPSLQLDTVPAIGRFAALGGL